MVEIGDKLTNSIDKKLVLRKTLEPTNPRKNDFRQTLEKRFETNPRKNDFRQFLEKSYFLKYRCSSKALP